MRSMTFMKSAASCLERRMRSSVWHCTQFNRKIFSLSGVGMLWIHSALVICAARFCGLMQLQIDRSRGGRRYSTAPGSSSS